MTAPKVEWTTRSVSGTKALQRTLETRAAQHQEDVARWKRDYPLREPGESRNCKTWNSYSQQRHASQAFRRNYGEICWRTDHGSCGHG